MDLVVSQMTWGIASSATCRVMCGIVGHMIRHTAEGIAWLAMY
jgi:hypothetical protein